LTPRFEQGRFSTKRAKRLETEKANLERKTPRRYTSGELKAYDEQVTETIVRAGNMQVKIAFIQSADLNTYTPFTVIPDSLSVVDGKICMEFPPSDAENFFFRFRIE